MDTVVSMCLLAIGMLFGFLALLIYAFDYHRCSPLFACLRHGRCWHHSEEETIDASSFNRQCRELEEHLGGVEGAVVVRQRDGRLHLRALRHPARMYTCHGCPGADTHGDNACEYAYDEYNTNGDCLADK